MTPVSFAVIGIVLLLGLFAVFAWRRTHAQKTRHVSRMSGRNAIPTVRSRLDSRFWWELALYGGGFVLMFYIFFGQALAVYLGYGDLT